MKNRTPGRSGVAAVELAVCLPILIIVAFVTIEVCAMLHLAQALKIASFEGARVGVVPSAEIENVKFQCETLLDSRGVKAYSISLTPSDPTALNEGEYFRVTIETDYEENALLGTMFGKNRVITRSTALRAN